MKIGEFINLDNYHFRDVAYDTISPNQRDKVAVVKRFAAVKCYGSVRRI